MHLICILCQSESIPELEVSRDQCFVSVPVVQVDVECQPVEEVQGTDIVDVRLLPFLAWSIHNAPDALTKHNSHPSFRLSDLHGHL